MAQIIGHRVTASGVDETVFRLDRPLQDFLPVWSTVMVQVRPPGERTVFRAKSYQTTDGSWRAVPGTDSWAACFHPLSARDLAAAEREIAAAAREVV